MQMVGLEETQVGRGVGFHSTSRQCRLLQMVLKNTVLNCLFLSWGGGALGFGLVFPIRRGP